MRPMPCKIDNRTRVKTRWTPAETTVQFRVMWRSFAALLLLVTPALAQENATAYEALRVVGRQFGRGALNHIVSITGVFDVHAHRVRNDVGECRLAETGRSA